MTDQNDDEIRGAVREHYAKIANTSAASGCTPGCCGGPKTDSSRQFGYSAEDQAASNAPKGGSSGPAEGRRTKVRLRHSLTGLRLDADWARAMRS